MPDAASHRRCKGKFLTIVEIDLCFFIFRRPLKASCVLFLFNRLEPTRFAATGTYNTRMKQLHFEAGEWLSANPCNYLTIPFTGASYAEEWNFANLFRPFANMVPLWAFSEIKGPYIDLQTLICYLIALQRSPSFSGNPVLESRTRRTPWQAPGSHFSENRCPLSNRAPRIPQKPLFWEFLILDRSSLWETPCQLLREA